MNGIPLVLDPVLAAGGGFPLLTADGIARLTAELFPLTHLLTPNAPEAARLAGIEVQTPGDLEEAARRLQAMGPRWVLAKGGHLPGEPVDVLTDGNNVYHLPGVRLAAPNHHGSGCLLASAAAAGLAQGAVGAGSGEPGPGPHGPGPQVRPAPGTRRRPGEPLRSLRPGAGPSRKSSPPCRRPRPAWKKKASSPSSRKSCPTWGTPPLTRRDPRTWPPSPAGSVAAPRAC